MSRVVISVMAFYGIYNLFLNVFDHKAIGIWELRPRMILSRKTLEKLKEDMDLSKYKMQSVGPDGLTPEQAEVLSRWWRDKNQGSTIWVARTMPFAPALFVGTVLTVAFGGYVVWT